MDDSFGRPMVGIIFVGLPWVILHYLTKWKTASSLTRGTNMLDSLYDNRPQAGGTPHRTVRRIVAADHPASNPPHARQTSIPGGLSEKQLTRTPAARKYYLDKANGKWMGVCSTL